MRSEQSILNETEHVAELLNDSSIDRVMAIDLNWNIIAWNKTSEQISGIAKEEVMGKNLLEAFPQILADEEMMQAIRAALSGRKSFLPSNMSTFNRQYSENHFIPLKNTSEEVIGVMNIMHDVAHRIKVEKQLQKLNTELEKKYQQLEKANKELATFTYITSRDIKEPLKHVYTSLEMLVKKEGHSLSNMSKGNLRRMQGALNKMNLLLDDILTVTGISGDDEKMDAVDLQQIFENARLRLAGKIEEKSAVIECDPLPKVPGNPKMLEYLFLNLLDNAIKFQPEEGKPTVKIRNEKVTGLSSGIRELLPDEEYLKIIFIDNGIGFPQEDASRIFEMFERLHNRKYHGSGIGLTICKKIVEAHDGYISVTSTPDQGSTFTCYLPMYI